MQKYSKEKLPPIGLKKVRVNKIDEGWCEWGDGGIIEYIDFFFN